MRLTFDEIKPLVHGAERKFEQDGVLWMLRFTEAQAEFYKDDRPMYEKSAATAGVHLDFMTDSRLLKLELDTVHADTVSAFWCDFYVDGAHSLSLYADLKDAKDGHLLLAPSLDLPKGSKHIAVYFPWTGCTRIRSMELEDGASFAPVKHTRRMVLYGDSITHGSWAKDASASYATRLSHALDAEGFNKGLGGDVMRVGFSAIKGEVPPDIVTVAYGTNDWSDKITAEALAEKSRRFYSDMSATYPEAKIFVISPIWRGDAEARVKTCGSFLELREILRKSAAGLSNVVFLDGYDLVPHAPEMFSPDLLHPSDLGFSHYAANLAEAMKPYLD